MNVEVIRRPIQGLSPIDELAHAHIQLLMLGASVKNVALIALIRLAGKALCDIEGADKTSNVFARHAYDYAQKAKQATPGRKRA